MPKVPTYDNFQVTPTTMPDARVSAPDMPDVAGRQLQQIGQGAMQAGDAASRMAVDAQDMVNQVRVNDAQNQLREAILQKTYDPNSGYLALKGKAALDPDADGRSMPDRYTSDIKDAAGDISSQLGNEAQRRAFALQSQGMLSSFQGDLDRHMLTEFLSYSNSVQDGTINLAGEQAKKAWNDPTKIDPALDSMRAAVYEKGRLNGWSASQTQAAMDKAVSNVHQGVVMAALENNNPQYAMGYLDRNKGDMTAEDILRVQGQVNQSTWANLAMNAVKGATVQMSSKIAPSDFDRMTAITAQTESGNKDFNPDGSVVTSKAGAKGRMQVMDATATDPGHGIAPADLSGTPQQQAAERSRVGTQLLQALVQKYGDPSKAWAAYNWGEGNVDKAIREANKNGNGDTWLAYAPKETQAYVNGNIAKLNAGASSVQRPTEQEFVDAATAKLPPGASPQAVKLTREQAIQQFGITEKSLNEQGDNAVRAAQQNLIQNGGNFAQLPPSMRDAVMRYAPAKWDDLQTFAKHVASPPKVDNMAAYHEALSNPDELAKMSDSTFAQFAMTNFNERTQKELAKLRQSAASGESDMSAGGLNAKALNATMDNRLLAIGIDPKAKDLATRQNIGTIQKQLVDGVFDQQRQLGRKMTPDEVTKYVDQQFRANFNYTNTVLGIPISQGSMPYMKMDVGSIPGDQLNQVKDALAALGNRNPTNDEILRTYRTAKMRKTNGK